MSTTTSRLLQAAAEIAGGETALAERLGIGEALLARFMAGTRALPDALLLRAVDIILADRHGEMHLRAPAVAPPVGEPAPE
ncbi:MAG TPA: hypothetical protein VFC18_17020 [Burkholderiales bacterium]|nr:hypothetical protein [Burkholderiales bacterium]